METNYKKQVMTYLTKTAGHTFQKKDESYFKVSIDGETVKVLEGNKLIKLDIDQYVKWYGENARNVVSHRLFLNKEMKSVKQTKYVKDEISEILKNIK
jgi:hypothetical protein